MASTLAWLDHDQNAQEATLRLLALFKEKESRDELGVGTIRDSFADQLFPGTSTIQTRLRYMLFVPWMYQSLEDKRIPAENFARIADQQERVLISKLLESHDLAGAFGKRSGENVKRLPASVYWSGLGRWGIRLIGDSQDRYHQNVDDLYRIRDTLTARENSERDRGDDVDTERRKATLSWHSSLPPRPAAFPHNANFHLTREEASFLCDRIRIACPDSLLAILAHREQSADVSAPWAHPDYATFPYTIRELLTHARLFSDIIYGASLSYNLQLARKIGATTLIEAHETHFDEWIAALPLAEIKSWDITRFWQRVEQHGDVISLKTRAFVEHLIRHIQRSPQTLINDEQALTLVRQREIDLKGARSRFKNQRALEQWGGYAGMGKLTYRWNTAKTFLNDLAQGLSGEEGC